MMTIDRKLTSSVTEEARNSPRLRKNLNFHADFADPVNRMLNAIEPGTYVRPHKHESPDKCEVFIILHGKAAALQFNNNGSVIERVVLDNTNGVYGVEIAPRKWHTIVSLAPDTVLYEAKPGPYVPLSDKDFAPWAPAEGSQEAANYLELLLTQLGLV